MTDNSFLATHEDLQPGVVGNSAPTTQRGSARYTHPGQHHHAGTYIITGYRGSSTVTKSVTVVV